MPWTALHHDLCTDLALRLQESVHVDARCDPARACGLGAADLPPSAVTAALRHAPGLNGRTMRPLAKAPQGRPRSAICDVEPVPWNINAQQARQNSIPPSRRPRRIFTSVNGHEIGRRDEFRLGVAASDDHAVRAARGQRRDHGLN